MNKDKNNLEIENLKELIKPDEFSPEEELKKAFIDPELDELEPPILIKIDGEIFATRGSFSVVTGKAKSRKTFFNTILLAAINGYDTNGLIEIEPDTKAVFFDTEQSRYYTKKVQNRVKEMAGSDDKTTFFCLRPYSPPERLEIIQYFVENNPDINLVIIDGIRDLLTDINNPEQSTEVSTWLMKLTELSDTHVINVLHQNKGDTNARGHIGTELINKAETALSVEKNEINGFSVVEPTQTRGKDFGKFGFFITDSGLPEIMSKEDLEAFTTQTTKKNDIPASFDETWHRDVIQIALGIEEKPTFNKFVQALKVALQDKGVTAGDNKASNFLTYYKKEGFVKTNGKKGTKHCTYEYVPTEPLY